MPAVKKLFATKAREQLEIKEFFGQNLEGVGFAGIDIQKTPIGTRVTIKAARPGLVIGKKGSNVKSLTEILARDFKIENPQIDVDEVKNPELNAQIMAERLASALEKGQHYRRAGYGLLRRIMRAGAEGCEIVITGKLTSQRSRYVKMHQGNIKRCGNPVHEVSHGCAHAKLKSGVQGVRISILPIGYNNPKEVVYLGTDKLSPEFKERVTSKEVITTPVPIAAAPKESPVEEEPVIAGNIEDIKPSIPEAKEAISKIKGKLPGTEDVLEEDNEGVIEDEDIEEDIDVDKEKDADADVEKKEPIEEDIDVDKEKDADADVEKKEPIEEVIDADKEKDLDADVEKKEPVDEEILDEVKDEDN